MNISGPRQRATFTLSPQTIQRLERTVAKNSRSQFVEEAVEKALKLLAVQRALETMRSVRGLSTGGENSTEFLRRKRLEWDGRPLEILEGSKE